jgi:asparagine synthase (glutamine-hydrolysing)
MLEAQSYFDPSGADGFAVLPAGNACTWDGRLDNRENLFLQVSRQVARASFSNAMAALMVFARRSADGLRELTGDWSVAIWDAPDRTMVLASDYAGIRPLYYYRDSHCLRWSSSLIHLVQWIGSAALDVDFAARFLMSRAVPGRTPYSGIHPVPPGSAVCVSAKGVSTARFWHLPVHQGIRLEDDRDYEEGLRNLFREAVQARLHTDTPVCAELSGGLDSSSVVCMASDILPSPLKPVTFSYTYEGSRDDRYFQEVERACHLEGIHLQLNEFSLVTAAQSGGAAPGWWEPRNAELARRMEQLGARVLLTGQVGDLIMGNLGDDSDQVAEPLRRGHLRQAVREAFAWSRALEVSLYSTLWRGARTAYSSWTAPTVTDIWSGPASPFTTMDSLTPAMRARVTDGESESGVNLRWREAAPSCRRRFRMLGQMLEGRMLQTPEPLQAFSYTHPFAHRPLVEFMMAIPPDRVCRPGEPRRLMRRAFAGLLPGAILKRRTKAAFTQSYRQALLPLAAGLAAQPAGIRVVELGYVESASLAERLTRFSQGLECNDTQLRQIILFEYWLRNRERADSGGESPDSLAVTPSAAQ